MSPLSSELFFGIPVGLFILAIVGYNINYSIKEYLSKGRNLIFIFYTVFLGLFAYQLISFMLVIIEMGKVKAQF